LWLLREPDAYIMWNSPSRMIAEIGHLADHNKTTHRCLQLLSRTNGLSGVGVPFFASAEVRKSKSAPSGSAAAIEPPSDSLDIRVHGSPASRNGTYGPGLWCRGKAEQIESNQDAKREEENDEADPVSLTPSMPSRFAIGPSRR
jgi:hypothetical protein